MPTGIGFKHNFDFSITTPLPPLDWYALIKYAKGYIGENMHPIVVALHNAVPCFVLIPMVYLNMHVVYVSKNRVKFMILCHVFLYLIIVSMRILAFGNVHLLIL